MLFYKTAFCLISYILVCNSAGFELQSVFTIHATTFYAMLQAENAIYKTKSAVYTVIVARKESKLFRLVIGSRDSGTEAVMKQSRTYYPNQIQVRIIEVADRNNIKVQVYERADRKNRALAGITACSNAVVSTVYELGLVDRKVTVHTSQGELEVELKENGRVEVLGTEGKNASIVLSKR